MPGTVVAPDAAHGVVVAGKDIEPAVVVDVGEVGALQKKTCSLQIGPGIALSIGGSTHQFDTVVGTTGKHVIEAVVVGIGNAHAPLAVVGNLAHRNCLQAGAIGFLQFYGKDSAVAQVYDVVVTISVHVGDAYSHAAEMIAVAEFGVGIGKGNLGLQRNAGQGQKGQKKVEVAFHRDDKDVETGDET